MSEERGLIPQEIIDEINERTDIVSLISKYVALKRTGANYMGLCPFHGEKTPSFSVSPSKQIFHCFGCGVGGNIFKFLMEIEHLSFPQAVRRLGKEAGVAIPEPQLSPARKKALQERKRLRAVNEKALAFYRQALVANRVPVIRQYLTTRGVPAEIEEKFELGACLPGWDHMTRALIQQGVSADDLLTLGLSGQSRKTGQLYDRFRDRLIFPIRNGSGHVVAFGGRILDPDAAPQKYLNSPETPLFHKGSELYGLYAAKDAIREADQVIIVEGYMDVLACHKWGVQNVVAPLGTALTDDQIKRLLRHTYHFTTAFDGDGAGIRATLKSLDRIEALGGHVRVLQLPAGQDPDEFLQAEGVEAFYNRIAEAPEGLAFRLKLMTKDADLSRIETQMGLLEKSLPALDLCKTPAEKDHAIRLIASFLDLSEQVVTDEYKYRMRYGRNRKKEAAEVPAQEAPAPDLADREWLVLAYLLMDEGYFAPIDRYGGPALFDNAANSLYELMKESYQTHNKISAGFLPVMYGEGLAKALSYIDRHIPAEKYQQHFCQLLTELRLNRLEAQYAAGLQALNESVDSDGGQAGEILDRLEALLIEKNLLEQGPRRET
ncbi:DNA primase [Peptococcus simiae]|uniref:DNA primase n=1 Tax=Peptococcus simiae TaxID=1643805 RepID=UPI0039806F28